MKSVNLRWIFEDTADGLVDVGLRNIIEFQLDPVSMFDDVTHVLMLITEEGDPDERNSEMHGFCSAQKSAVGYEQLTVLVGCAKVNRKTN